jgi:hypothetical protein
MKGLSIVGALAGALLFVGAAGAGHRTPASAQIRSLGGGVSASQPKALVPQASAGPQAVAWHNGLIKYAGTEDCITGPILDGMGAYVGWYGDIASPPQVGQVYYLDVGWSQIADPCTGGSRVHVEIGLPAGTELYINSTYKVRCFYQGPKASSFSEFMTDCPQVPKAGIYGGAAFDSAQGPWPTAFGSQFWMWIPVISHQPLDGIDIAPPTQCAACVYGGVWFIDGVFSPWVFPHQGVLVGGSATGPVVTYPVPSVCAVTNPPQNPQPCKQPLDPTGTTAETHGYIFPNSGVGT